MNDNQLIKALEEVTKICRARHSCYGCVLGSGDTSESNKFVRTCQIRKLGYELSNAPEGWNMSRIERIINE